MSYRRYLSGCKRRSENFRWRPWSSSKQYLLSISQLRSTP